METTTTRQEPSYNARYCEWLVNKFGSETAAKWQDAPITFSEWVNRGMPFCRPIPEAMISCVDCGELTPDQKSGPPKERCDSCGVNRRRKTSREWKARKRSEVLA